MRTPITFPDPGNRSMIQFAPLGFAKGFIEIGERHRFKSPPLVDEIVRQMQAFCRQRATNTLPKLVVGLSGGVDSSTVVYLAARAVGPKNVIPLTIPSRAGEECLALAERVRTALGINGPFRYVQSIQKYVELFREENPDADRIDLGNFASRLRISLLYSLARRVNGYVLGTGNRTEFVLGYAAKYGTPLSCDFGILDELYKIDIYELASTLGVPDEIRVQKPSTGYYDGQTHEEELGASFLELDVAAFLLFKKQLAIEKIVSEYGASEEFLLWMIGRYQYSEHKRKLQAEHVRLDYLNLEGGKCLSTTKKPW